MVESSNTPTKARPEDLSPRPEAEINDLMGRARKGDRSCISRLRALLSGPDGRRYIDNYGSPPEWLFDALARSIFGDNASIREAFRSKLDEVRRDLEGPDPTPMERLLAERAVFCWAEVNIRQTNYEQTSNLSIRQADFHQRRIDAAHRRFLSAVRTLATVRKLAVPTLRINVARHQVNLG